VIDDFSIAMNVRRQGLGVIYNPLAIATEEVAPNLKEEFRRRVRIGAGNYQALALNYWAMSPSRGIFAWCFWSHKVMRWFVPHAMVLALVSNALLLDRGVFRVLFVLQLGFYLSAWVGSALLSSGRRVPRPVALVTFFVSMNVALGQGCIRFMLGRHSGAWRRTDRSVEERR
jgi:cellulose synthase/poly-beta-1,6-N-acetylglucosamine synthase-like glycosyltransferase